MAETALMWLQGLAGAGSAVAALGQSAPKMPKPQMPAKPDTAGGELAAESAEKRKAAKKKGYESTILTAGKDLGFASVKKKTLLGE